MATLNKYDVRQILRYLDTALADTRANDAAQLRTIDGPATWSIKAARDVLLEAAIADVEVEMAEAA